MGRKVWDRVEAARLLRELAEELLMAEGTARNGLFLELHRLHDTIFRLALEEHPEAPPALAAQAFSLDDALPAPQVLRELHGLGSELVTSEIRSLYKHMNMARNNMAHEAVLDRVIVSRSNSKRMARLARLVADQLDPAGEGQPTERLPVEAGLAIDWSRALCLLAGFLAGLVTGWGWFAAGSVTLAALAGGGALVGGSLLLRLVPPAD